MDSYNYDLPEGMTPKTYNPPLRRNRRRRYEVRKKYEVDIKEPFNNTSDRVFQADQESTNLELLVQPRTVADDGIPISRDQPVDRGRGSSIGNEGNMSSDEDSNLCDRPVAMQGRHGTVRNPKMQVIRNIGTTSTAWRARRCGK